MPYNDVIAKKTTKILNKKFNKIVIWGLKSRSYDSFRYIQKSFYQNLQKLKVKSIWIDDKIENQKYVESGDLVISSNRSDEFLPIDKKVFYCLHNPSTKHVGKTEKEKTLTLQVYSKGASVFEKINSFQYFDKKNKFLYQPWGTDLLPREFMSPAYSQLSPFSFWVGSIWDNVEKQGNREVIDLLKKVLKKNKLIFMHAKGVSEKINIKLTRYSRIAPAIAGSWQVDNDYLPCRYFKNISYGQLGISNILAFKEISKNSNTVGPNMEEIIENSLSISKKNYQENVVEQQQNIVKCTYAQNLLNIANYVDV